MRLTDLPLDARRVNPRILAMDVVMFNARLAANPDAVAGMEDRISPSGPFFAPAAASGADRFSSDRVKAFMKLARAL